MARMMAWCEWRETALPKTHSTETKNNHKWLFLLSLVRVEGVEPSSQVWKTCILTAVLHSQPNIMGWEMGLEPTTSWTTIKSSNQLSYSHHKIIISQFLEAGYFGKSKKAIVPAAAPRIIVKITATIKLTCASFSGFEIIVTGPFGSSFGVTTFFW